MCQAAGRVNEFVMFNCPTPTTFNGPYFIFQFVHLRKLTTSFNNFLNSCKHFLDTDGATEGGCDKIYFRYTIQRKATQYYLSTRKPICKIPRNRITYLRVLASNKHDMINEMFLAPRGSNNVHWTLLPHPADHFTTTWRVYVSAAVLKLEKLLQKLYLIGGLLLLLITITVNFEIIKRKLH